MKVNSPVKIGVIGCGGYAFELIKRILSVPRTGCIAAVTSRDVQSPGARYCMDRGIPVFKSVPELLEFGQFDAVINPTPIHLHASVSKQCLDAGFPVWMEKPPVATVQELDELNKYSQAKGHAVSVCFNSLYSHLVQQLKREIVGGRFGKVRQVKGIGAWIRNSAYFTRNTWAGKLQLDGQWILDGDVNNPFAHVLCNNLFFASSEFATLAEPYTVEAELYRSNAIESEDTSCLRIITTEGVEVLNWLTLSPNKEIPPRTVIETEKALISFEDFKRLKIEFYDGSLEEHEAYQEDRIEMIEQLSSAVRMGGTPWGDLEMMRPFTLAVNGVFESARKIRSIPSEYLSCESDGVSSRIIIKGASEIFELAFESNSLFSEIDVPWSHKGEKFNMADYKRFPVRFRGDS